MVHIFAIYHNLYRFVQSNLKLLKLIYAFLYSEKYIFENSRIKEIVAWILVTFFFRCN